MITLFQFPRMWNVDNPSPYCMKVETYLRLAKIPYEVKVVRNPANGPKGKVPFIKDDGVLLGDSSFIVEYLVKKNGDKLDAALSAGEKNQSYLMRRFFEDVMINYGVYQRFVDEDFWPQARAAIFAFLPKPMAAIIGTVFRKKVMKRLKLNGLLLHTKDEIYYLAEKDIGVIAEFLGNKKFFMGEQPTSLDATAYGFLAQFIKVPLKFRLKDIASKHKNIVEYVDRMEKHLDALAGRA